MVTIEDHILDGADEDADVSPRERRHSHGRARPRYILPRGPGEPKQAKRQPYAANHGRKESVFRRDLVRRVTQDLFSVEEYVAQKDGYGPQHASHHNGQKHQAGLLHRERIGAFEDIGYRSKEGEQSGKLACHIQADETDNSLGEEHVDGSKQRDGEERLRPFADGRLIRDFVSKVLGTAALQDRVEGFPTESQCNDEAKYGKEKHRPLGPTPSFAANYESTDDGPRRRVSTFYASDRRQVTRNSYPRPGPKNGVRMYSVEGIARCSG